MSTRVIFVVLAVATLAISILAHFESRFPGDLQTTVLFQSVHSPALLAAMEGISYAASGWRAAVIIGIGALITWRWLGGLEGGMALFAGLTSPINEVLKMVINRPRPTTDLGVNVIVAANGTSFPSGHAFFATLFLGMLAYLIVTHQTRRRLKILTCSIALFLILWIGASRVYLGVHWTSDVIGGYMAGAWFLVGEIRLYRKLQE